MYQRRAKNDEGTPFHFLFGVVVQVPAANPL
jgi:hypothetical protein